MDSARGDQLYQSQGCVECHQLKGMGGKTVAPDLGRVLDRAYTPAAAGRRRCGTTRPPCGSHEGTNMPVPDLQCGRRRSFSPPSSPPAILKCPATPARGKLLFAEPAVKLPRHDPLRRIPPPGPSNQWQSYRTRRSGRRHVEPLHRKWATSSRSDTSPGPSMDPAGSERICWSTCAAPCPRGGQAGRLEASCIYGGRTRQELFESEGCDLLPQASRARGRQYDAHGHRRLHVEPCHLPARRTAAPQPRRNARSPRASTGPASFSKAHGRRLPWQPNLRRETLRELPLRIRPRPRARRRESRILQRPSHGVRALASWA